MAPRINSREWIAAQPTATLEAALERTERAAVTMGGTYAQRKRRAVVSVRLREELARRGVLESFDAMCERIRAECRAKKAP